MVYLSETTEAVYIVMELASGGELFQQLLQKGSYTEKDASSLVRQMLQGLAYLHDQDVSCWMDWVLFLLRLMVVS